MELYRQKYVAFPAMLLFIFATQIWWVIMRKLEASIYYMLLIAYGGMALLLAEGNYGCPKVNTKAIPLQQPLTYLL